MSNIISLSTINSVVKTTEKSFKISPELDSFITHSCWNETIKNTFKLYLQTHKIHTEKLNLLFSSPDLFQNCVPIIAYSEIIESFIIIYADRQALPPEPGEPGSILSYFRSYGHEEDILCSDCYGQLSCSSCAIEIHHGLPENTTPREEEFDMLDIDEERPATKFTRLSCQALLGDAPLILTIRKSKTT